jgi:hypothetical protein
MSNQVTFGYIAFFQGKRLELRADNLYHAKIQAVAALKVPKTKQGLLAVVLAENPDGTPVIHSTASL